jgi:hypothetical protein
MELYAIFEIWHLSDGNYPALERGMLVNLSFEMEPDELERIDRGIPHSFNHLGDAEYVFCGEVLRVYRDEGDLLIVIACGEFRFYVNAPLAQGFAQGDSVKGGGTLVLDHYIWVEFLHRYRNAPDLFYKLRVDSIKRIKLPEHFIARLGPNISFPTRLKAVEYGPNDVAEVDVIVDEEFCHYVVHFTDQDLPDVPVPKTFLPR